MPRMRTPERSRRARPHSTAQLTAPTTVAQETENNLPTTSQASVLDQAAIVTASSLVIGDFPVDQGITSTLGPQSSQAIRAGR